MWANSPTESLLTAVPDFFRGQGTASLSVSLSKIEQVLGVFSSLFGMPRGVSIVTTSYSSELTDVVFDYSPSLNVLSTYPHAETFLLSQVLWVSLTAGSTVLTMRPTVEVSSIEGSHKFVFFFYIITNYVKTSFLKSDNALVSFAVPSSIGSVDKTAILSFDLAG